MVANLGSGGHNDASGEVLETLSRKVLVANLGSGGHNDAFGVITSSRRSVGEIELKSLGRSVLKCALVTLTRN